MMELVRSLGRGILYTLLSPFYVAYFLLTMMYGILVYLFMETSSIVLFFLGKSYTGNDYETNLLNQRKKQHKARMTPNVPRSNTRFIEGDDNHDR